MLTVVKQYEYVKCTSVLLRKLIKFLSLVAHRLIHHSVQCHAKKWAPFIKKCYKQIFSYIIWFILTLTAPTLFGTMTSFIMKVLVEKLHTYFLYIAHLKQKFGFNVLVWV